MSSQVDSPSVIDVVASTEAVSAPEQMPVAAEVPTTKAEEEAPENVTSEE